MDPIWADLINSDWRDHRGTGAREDRLGNDAWLARFLARAGWDRPALPGRRERDGLRTLRAVLRRVVDAVMAGHRLAAADLRSINHALASAPLTPRLRQGARGFSVDTRSGARGIEAVRGRVARELAQMLAKGEPERLKVCANPDCGWVLWDASRNRTRRWCVGAECGNLVNVRRFRRRQRSARGPAPRSRRAQR